MAITKVAQFSPSPGSTTDYQAQNAHLSAFIRQTYSNSLHLTEWSTTTVPQIAQGVYLHHAGVLYIVDAADFDIAAGDLSAAGTYYIKLTTSGDSLAVAWEDTLTSYAWSHAYQGLYNGTSQILPYSVVYDGASAYAKSRILNPMSASTAWVLESYGGGVTVTSLTADSITLEELSLTDYAAGAVTYLYDGDLFMTNSNSYVEALSCTMISAGTLTIEFEYKKNQSGEGTGSCDIQLRKNGVALYSVSTTSTDFVTFSEDVTYVNGDTIAIYVYNPTVGGAICNVRDGRAKISALQPDNIIFLLVRTEEATRWYFNPDVI